MVKTVTLTSNIERAVNGLNSKHAIVRNFSNNIIYVGTSAGVVIGDFNVRAIPPLTAELISNIPNGTIYVLTTGVIATIECEGTDYINHTFTHDLSGGGAGSGVISYDNLTNKPKINGNILSGDVEVSVPQASPTELGGFKCYTISQAEYDALPDEVKTSDTLFFITDQ